LTALVFLLLAVFSAPAQERNPQSAVDSLVRSSLHVDQASGAMQMQIPLGEYKGRGGASLPIVLSYSSKLWNLKYLSTSQCSGEPQSLFQAEYSKGSASGWTSSLGWFLPSEDLPWEVYDSATQKPSHTGHPNLWEITRKFIRLPDGSRHEVRLDDALHVFPANASGMYYAVDGSRIKYDSTTSTIYMPDGSRYVAGDPYLFIDSNGNTLSYSNGTWTDTLGRNIGVPIGGSSGSAGQYTYAVPGVNGSTMSYTMVWRNLGDALTDPNDQLHYKGDMPTGSCGPGNPQPNGLFTTLFQEEKVLQSTLFNPVVLYQIVLPNNTSYTFTYNVYGEINKIVYPTGGYEAFGYGPIDPLGGQLDDGTTSQANRGVVGRIMNDGVTTQTWTYGSTMVGEHTTVRSVTASDGTTSQTYFYKGRGADIKYGFEDSRAGMATEERVYNSSGTMLRRTLYQLAEDGPQSGGYATATRNARVTKKVDIILDTGGDALASATEFNYDADLNVISTKHYGYSSISQSTAQTGDIASIPNGAPLRTEETTFLVNDPNIDAGVRSAYRSRHLISLPTSSRVKDGNGNIVAQSSIAYDETSLLNPGSTNGWTDPQTAYRGNPTTTSSWLNTTNSYLSSHATYDQFGNVRTATDAKGNQSSVDYSSIYSYAYPTTATTSVPDPTGGHGSNTAFVTSSVFDLNTGLMVSTTDPNNVTTTFAYADSLNRLTRTVRASGTGVQSQTTVAYDDANRLITKTSDQNNFDDNLLKSQVVYDLLGRKSESRTYVSGSSFIAVRQEYDAMGRVYRVTNPFDSGATHFDWTTNEFDSLGRVKKLTTPDTAFVTTSYSGNSVTVTDQAGKARRSVSDALGRLVEVYEDPAGANYLTSYSYDTLDNLTQITQGTQPPRTFIYDSLKRLTSATNPESGTVSYQYDANGNLTSKTDARGVVSNYVYDALNRVTVRLYRINGQPDPNTGDVEYLYDNAQNGKGRLWLTFTWGASPFQTAVGGYDALGRVTQLYRLFGNGQGGWNPAYEINYGYDRADQVTTMTYPSRHTVSSSYDGAGRLASFSGNLGDGGASRTYATGITYSSFGGLQQEQFGTQTAVYHKLHYNVRGQLNDIRASTVPWQTDQWNWDRGAILNWYDSTSGFTAQNPNSGTDNNGSLLRQSVFIPDNEQISSYKYFQQNFDYDTLNRLKSATELASGTTPSFAQYYSYDRWGNRTIDQTNTWGAGISKPNFGVDTNTNRLTAPAGYSMNYDQAGNLTNDTYTGQGARTYEAENRMKQAWANGQWQTYTYDGDGRRIKRNVNGTETWQVYGLGGELIAEYAANGAPSTPQKEYGYRNGELLITAEPGTSTYDLQPLVTGKALGAQRADSPGWAGFKMTVGAQSITVNSLGRQCSSGNSSTHELRLIRVSDNSMVASTNVPMAGCAVGQYKYANLSNPITLAANTAYLLVSYEVGGDLFHDWLNTALTTTSAATVNHGVYTIDGGQTWGVAGSTGNSYVPLDLKYQAPPSQSFVTGKTLAAQRSDSPGWAGFEMSIGAQPITVTSLGRYCSAGNSLTHEERIIRSSDNATLASVNVAMSGCTAGTTKYASLANPVTLSANTAYRVVSYEVGSDLFHDWTGLYLSTTAAATVLHGVYTTDGGQTWGPAGGAGSSYVPVDFQYQATSVTGVDLRWLVADQLGTPRMIFDQTGSLSNMSRHDYLPFGEELFAGTGGRTTTQGYPSGPGADGVRQQFTEKERDNETGLDYFGARYFASTQGRFTSPDPLLSSGRSVQPQSWNRYSYVINRPLSLVDPNGLDWGQYTDAKGHRSYHWFDGKIGKWHGNDYVAVPELAKGGSSLLIHADDGTLVRIRNSGFVRVTEGRWRPTPVVNPAQDQLNQLGGAVAGVGHALVSVQPYLHPVVDWAVHQMIGGVEEDSGYHNVSQITGALTVTAATAAAPFAEPGNLFHYTSASTDSILEYGLQTGSTGEVFTTTAGDLTAAEAQSQLALNPSRGLPTKVFEIDVHTLESLGIKMPPTRTVAPMHGMPGGGTEVIFNQAIPGEAIHGVRHLGP
jgi:RHS repeat-associated protein